MKGVREYWQRGVIKIRWVMIEGARGKVDYAMKARWSKTIYFVEIDVHWRNCGSRSQGSIKGVSRETS